jgi:restriction system protein
MSIPSYQEFMRPLLEILVDGAEHSIRDCYRALADRFNLTDEERTQLIPSGTQRLLDNRVGWAKTYLLKAGLVESPRRGVVRVTDRGRQALASSARIDTEYLSHFKDFVEFVAGKGDERPGPVAKPETVTEPTATTPEELIAAGYEQVQRALASDLSDRVKSSSPAFFERLVVALLVKMGYGGSLSDAGQALGRTGDEGIDGIIKEDRLGLDVIYIQAKRWDNTVGRPEIQRFAGALQGQRARKGVFITTSSFSPEARSYANLIETRIVLIDGVELARLMIAHGVGVTPIAIYELKRVDTDFFAED